MIDFENMTVKQRMQYELAHTPRARQREVVQDYRRGQVAILTAMFVLVFAVYLIGPVIEKVMM